MQCIGQSVAHKDIAKIRQMDMVRVETFRVLGNIILGIDGSDVGIWGCDPEQNLPDVIKGLVAVSFFCGSIH